MLHKQPTYGAPYSFRPAIDIEFLICMYLSLGVSIICIEYFESFFLGRMREMCRCVHLYLILLLIRLVVLASIYVDFEERSLSRTQEMRNVCV